jgi:predicted RNA binding protein YcfA (HicA-like mRNA interferase family)
MSQLDKLIERIRRRPPEADFGDVRRLLEALGWTLAREQGSHAVFTKPGEWPLVIPRVSGRRVKRVYLDLLCERLGLESDPPR